MKVTAWIETSTEVDIPIEQIIEELEGIGGYERIQITERILNTCIGLLSKIPDDHVAILTPIQRQLVADCMKTQEKRYAMGGEKRAAEQRVDELEWSLAEEKTDRQISQQRVAELENYAEWVDLNNPRLSLEEYQEKYKAKWEKSAVCHPDPEKSTDSEEVNPLEKTT